jgi:hypothetical protein
MAGLVCERSSARYVGILLNPVDYRDIVDTPMCLFSWLYNTFCLDLWVGPLFDKPTYLSKRIRLFWNFMPKFCRLLICNSILS